MGGQPNRLKERCNGMKNVRQAPLMDRHHRLHPGIGHSPLPALAQVRYVNSANALIRTGRIGEIRVCGVWCVRWRGGGQVVVLR